MDFILFFFKFSIFQDMHKDPISSQEALQEGRYSQKCFPSVQFFSIPLRLLHWYHVLAVSRLSELSYLFLSSPHYCLMLL